MKRATVEVSFRFVSTERNIIHVKLKVRKVYTVNKEVGMS